MSDAAARDRDEYVKLVAYLSGWMAANRQSMAKLRDAMDAAESSIALPEGMTASPWRSGELSGQIVVGSSTQDDRVMLYLHGGGYHYGSSRSHRHLAAAIAASARCDTLVLDYRRAPEHVYPAAIDDAFEAYRSLLETRKAGRIAIAGDSAGGGLAIATAMAARNRNMPTPSAIVCMSPWLDLTCRELTETEAMRTDDPIVSMHEMREYASSYLAGADAREPGASPLHGALDGLPPVYLQTGRREIVARDTLEFAASSSGTVLVELQADAPHVWQWFWPRLGGARTAVEKLGRFLDEQFE